MTAPSLFQVTQAREVTRHIIFHRANPNARNEAGDTVLHSALKRYARLAIIKEIVRLGGRVDLTDAEGNFPVFRAVYHPDIEVLAFLLEAGADVDGPRRGYSPLHAAAYNDFLDKADLLLKRGANPNKPGLAGEPPLFAAHSTAMARLLIGAGANPYQRDFKGQSVIERWRDRGFAEALAALAPPKARLRLVGGSRA